MNCISKEKKFNNIIRLLFFLIIISLVLPNLNLAQTKEQKKDKKPDPRLHHEVKDDDYIPINRENQGRSPAYDYTMSNIITHQVNVDGNGQNIVGDAANEPSIAVDPTNRNNIVIGWRQFNTVNSNFRQAGYGYTTNGGQTWTFPGVIEPGVFRSDPVLDSDVNGNFYYNSLTNNPDYYCKVFKSSTGGSSWNSGVDAKGGDKQWMTIDKTNGPGSGHIYAYWTSWYSTCYPEFFTRSTNTGASFENCVSIPNDPSWGTLMVAPNGNLYVGGTDGYSYDFVVVRSTNAQISGQTVTWDMTTVVDLGGSISGWGGPNPVGLLGQTNIAIDTSGGTNNGYIYLLCSVVPSLGSDPLDVMFTRSTNGGVSWSSPVRVNDDASTSAWQWFGTMSVAPTGRIDVIWLDTRDNPGTYLSALYYSNSTDGGVTWSTNERLSDFFNPHVGWPQQEKMGDYFHMVSDINGASLAWAATFNNEQDVYYSYIDVVTTFQLVVDVNDGWNIVSVPGINPDGQGVEDWWPGRVGDVYEYVGGYQTIISTTPGQGYWMKNNGAQTYNTGDEWPAGGIQIVPHDPIAAVAGWNLIGGYENVATVANITTNPPGLQDGPVYGYNAGYITPATIEPGYGYWIKLSAAGDIILPEAMAKSTDPIEWFKESWGRILITDATGKKSTLYAVTGDSPDGGASVDLNQYEMPPLPPQGIFDIRFSSGRIAEDINSAIKTIDMTGVTYPLTLRVENMGMRIMDETAKKINENVKNGENIVIADAQIQKLMVSGELLPIMYSLEQNYPNPFNPNTIIKFSIAKEGRINLSVYNIIGERVKELKNEMMKPGYYEVEFDATELASGIYFYGIKAVDPSTGSGQGFIETKKMVLIK